MADDFIADEKVADSPWTDIRLARLMHEKDDFVRNELAYADRAMSREGSTAGTEALIRRKASRSRTLSQHAGHWWNSRSGMV
jgi:hypothetical protein